MALMKTLSEVSGDIQSAINIMRAATAMGNVMEITKNGDLRRSFTLAT